MYANAYLRIRSYAPEYSTEQNLANVSLSVRDHTMLFAMYVSSDTVLHDLSEFDTFK